MATFPRRAESWRWPRRMFWTPGLHPAGACRLSMEAACQWVHCSSRHPVRPFKFKKNFPLELYYPTCTLLSISCFRSSKIFFFLLFLSLCPKPLLFSSSFLPLTVTLYFFLFSAVLPVLSSLASVVGKAYRGDSESEGCSSLSRKANLWLRE